MRILHEGLPERARPGDIPIIAGLLEGAQPHCVPMSVAEIDEHLDEFEVIREAGGRVVATVALRPLDGDRAELRSLAVSPRWQGLGLGTRLVDRATVRAIASGRELVCVTRQRGFFRSHGFTDMPLSSLPPKEGVPRGGPPRVAMALPRTRVARGAC